MIRLSLEIVNEKGLHARAASRFVQIAMNYESVVKIRCGDKEVNGKSIMGIMILAAAKGKLIEVSVDGRDEQEAVQKLAELVKDGFGELV